MDDQYSALTLSLLSDLAYVPIIGTANRSGKIKFFQWANLYFVVGHWTPADSASCEMDDEDSAEA